MNEVLIAIGGTGLITTLLNRIAEGFFSRRRAKAEAQKVEAEITAVDMDSMAELQRMYQEALGHWRVAVEHAAQCDKKLALAVLDIADQDKRIKVLEEKLTAAKEAL